FQRPDDHWVNVDTTRNSLSGYGGNFEFSKISGDLNFMIAGMWKSPGLEVNDLGYFRMADEMMQVVWVGYNFFEPFSIFRELHLSADQFSAWDFGGELSVAGFETGFNAFFKNFWSLNLHSSINGPVRYNSLLRGGPSMILPGDFGLYAFLETDDRKKLVIEPFLHINNGFLKHKKSTAIGIEFEYRPANSINLSIEPIYDQNFETLQYVKQLEQQGQDRYIFSSINQKVLSLSFRANVTLNPELTIQYWGQPFIANGDYFDFKYVTDGEAGAWEDRFYTFNRGEIILNEETNAYAVKESKTGLDQYNIDNPDFQVNEFLSNLVLRWEYNPGSFLYLVWSQSRNDIVPESDFNFKRDFSEVWNIYPTNIILLKASFRLGR
ncbi:MAG TPA: DUF5916 domain-containing protein, partial [Bacteroidales bacterium]|nr:DUF5916 domain-containing protein [Bacteroidales bacterium]